MWKKILIGVLALIILLVLVGFLLPDKMKMSRSVTINAPAEYSFEEVNMLENWKNWSYWNNLDTTMAVTYGDKRAGEGGWYSWQSEQMGNGKLTITESVPNKSIKADLDFMENGQAKSWFAFEPEGEATKVTMGFSADYGMNPVMRWIGATMMEGEMNKAFDYNLDKIKKLAESKPKFSVQITEENVPSISYIGLSKTMSPKDMMAVSNEMAKMYGELWSVLKKSKVEMNGYPFAVYPKWSPESMEMICALPVKPDSKLPSKYKIEQTQGGRVVKAVHKGAYDNLQNTHDELNQYVKYRKLEEIGAPFEVYVTDPSVEKDTAKWITEVYYVVR